MRPVWARRLWTPGIDADLDRRFREMCVRESVAAFEGFLDALGDARWANDLQRERAAENNQRQLRLAAAAGLRIPRTLVTNDPEAARQFYEETEGQLVAKLLRPLTVGMHADSEFVYKSRVRAEDMGSAETLRHSPIVFQGLIPKERELRVAWVDGEAFAARSTRAALRAGRRTGGWPRRKSAAGSGASCPTKS